jgi:ribosomal protein S18 acetylase RimI-like enzyme
VPGQVPGQVPGRPRLVHPDEYAAVSDLVLRAYEAAGVVTADDSYRGVLADTAGRAAKADVYVIDDDAGQLVGTVTLSPHGSAYAQVAEAGELEFRMLAVDPAAAGRGFGRALIGFCAEQAAARGGHSLALCAIETNVAAIRLYEQLGFTHQPARDLQVSATVRLLVYTCPA